MENKPVLGAPEDGPPFFKSWTGMYYLVLGVLVGTIALFAVISAVYQ